MKRTKPVDANLYAWEKFEASADELGLGTATQAWHPCWEAWKRGIRIHQEIAEQTESNSTGINVVRWCWLGVVVSLSITSGTPGDHLWWLEDTHGYRHTMLLGLSRVDTKEAKGIQLVLLPFRFLIAVAISKKDGVR